MEKLKDKVVLIVDDEPRNTYALANYLQTLGMTVESAEDGADAMTKLQNGLKTDIILLDMMMPVMDGYEMLRLLKQNEILKDIPVIAVTAKTMKGDMEKCMEAGAWDYVPKPIKLNVLIDKMIRWIH